MVWPEGSPYQIGSCDKRAHLIKKLAATAHPLRNGHSKHQSTPFLPIPPKQLSLWINYNQLVPNFSPHPQGGPEQCSQSSRRSTTDQYWAKGRLDRNPISLTKPRGSARVLSWIQNWERWGESVGTCEKQIKTQSGRLPWKSKQNYKLFCNSQCMSRECGF